MINKMREMAPMIMLIILIAFVGGTIFLDWGMNLTGRGNKMMPAGKINGKEIPLTYFDQQVNMERQRVQEGGKDVPPEQYRMIPEQVWEREINKRLMKDVVEKLHLEASAEEVFSYIKKNPLPGIDTVSFFQTDGRFDTTKYEQFLNDPQNYQQYRWLHEIEAYTTSSIVPAQKLEQLLSAGAIPSPSEVAFNYLQKNNKVVFEYIKSNTVKVDSANVTDDMVKGYYETHRDSFEIDDHADLYYVKFSKEATDADEQFYRQELLELKDRIEQSELPLAEAFAKEAEFESDDPGSATKGGDLDWFSRGRMVGPFDTAAFTQEVGTISEPVKSDFGLHLIYVEAREERGGELQVHARHILRKIAPTIESLDLLAERADSLRIAMLDKGFSVAAREEKGIIFDSTGLFEKGGPIPVIGILSGAGKFAFGKNDAVVSERLENNDGIYLLAVKRKIDKGLMPFEDAKKEITRKMADSLRLASVRKYMEGIRQKLADSVSLVSYKDIDSTVVSGVTDTVTGGTYVPQIGFSSPVVARAMTLPVGSVSEVIEYNKVFYIVKTLWYQPVDTLPAMNTPEMEQIASMLKNQSAQKIYYDWYLNYKNKAKIKSNIADLYLD